jgi:cytochrome c553
MKKLAIIALTLLAFIAAWAVVINAEEGKEEAAAHEYVGATKCKTCHKDQFTSWEETSHAKAFGVLSAEEQKKEECVGCHTTGTTAKGELLEGVQCEACHGPGSDYKSPKIMSKSKWPKDPEGHMKMAMEAGLIVPTEEVCVGCHKKEGNPNFKEFDFATAKTKVHAFKEAEEAKAEE